MNYNIIEKYIKFKILEVKYLYKKIIKIIFNYEKNLYLLEQNMLISSSKKNMIIQSIYSYNKKLNTKYNDYLNNLSQTQKVPQFYIDLINQQNSLKL